MSQRTEIEPLNLAPHHYTLQNPRRHTKTMPNTIPSFITLPLVFTQNQNIPAAHQNRAQKSLKVRQIIRILH